MKILFTITYYHPYVSGLTLAASRWAEGLARIGDTVSVLAMSGEARSRSAGRVRVIVAKPLMKISKGFLSWDWIVQSWRKVSEHDVVVVNLPQLEGIVPAMMARLQGKRLVSVYHCEIVMPEGFFNSIVQSIVELCNFFTVFLSHAVVTYTGDYAKHSKVLRSLLSLRKELTIETIVPPIPKSRENSAMTGVLKKRIGYADAVIGVAARLATEKGIEYLIEALPQITYDKPNPPVGRKGAARRIKIAVAGPTDPVGETAYKQKIMRLVRRYRKQIILLGEIKPEDMGAFYSLLDVLVLPSVNSTEAFGMVQVEAMFAGIPVIASNLPGVRVPVRKTGMGIIVPPRDPAALAEAVSMILQDKESYTKDIHEIEQVFTAKKSLFNFRALLTGS